MTVMMVGGALVLLRVAVPPRIAVALELAVALMLIVLGVLNLLGARQAEQSSSRMRPLLVGMVHGMAGSAAIALLVLATIRDSTLGLAYLLVFGIGTIAGMVAVTGLLVLPVTMMVARSGVSRRWLTAVSGLASLVFGVLMVQALGGELIAAEPMFMPR